MRSAALIFGLVAGVLGGVVIAMSNLGTDLGALIGEGRVGVFAAAILLYGVVVLGLLGAGLALWRPRLAGVLMLLSAAAWAAAAFAADHGAVFVAALPFTFVGSGGLVALFARRRFDDADGDDADGDDADRNDAPDSDAAAGERRRLPGRRAEDRTRVPVGRFDEPAGYRGDRPLRRPADRRMDMPRSEPGFDLAPQRAAPLPAQTPPRARRPAPPPPPLAEEPFEEETGPQDYDDEEPDYIDADQAPAEEATEAAEAMDYVDYEDEHEAEPGHEPETELPPDAYAYADHDDLVHDDADPDESDAYEDYEDPDAAEPMAEPVEDDREPDDAFGPHEDFIVPDEPAEPVAPPRRDPPRARSRHDRWTLPDPRPPEARREPEAPLPEPRAEIPRYAAERQPPIPTRSERLAPRLEPRRPDTRPEPTFVDPYPEAAPPDEDDDFGPPVRNVAPRPAQPRPLRDVPRPARRVAYDDDDYDEDPDEPADAPRRRPGRVRVTIRILIAAIFILLLLAIAAFVYFDYLRGPRSLLFGARAQSADTISAAPDTARPAAGRATTPAAGASALVSAAAKPAPVNPPLSRVSASDAAVAATSPVPLAPIAAAAPSMSDPFGYCRTVGTIDAPDDRYTGPALPKPVASALGLSAPPPGRVYWRCAGQSVLACNPKGTAACDLTPTVDLMMSYCSEHPNTTKIPAPNGFWSCDGKRPSIPQDQQWPVDGRGFYPPAWIRVLPPATG